MGMTRAMAALGLAREVAGALARPPGGADPAPGGYDRVVDGANRLPRPLLTLGALALFAHAMIDPEGFGWRMQGLAQMPEPLWWLVGAIVTFHFGARETHYRRTRALEPPEGNPALAHLLRGD